jgi:DNA-binding SARP family transcriptional activator
LTAEPGHLEIHDTTPPEGNLRVWLLGGFRVAIGSQTIDPRQWRRRKVAGLIKVLALAGGRLHRDKALEQLWPELPAEAAANNLYQALHHARRILDSAGPTTTRFLQIKADVVELCPEGEPWIDAAEFEAHAARARQSQDPGACRVAVDLYAGDLLPDEPYEEWATSRREALRQTYLELLLHLARLEEGRRETNAAISTLQQALAVDPINEKAHVGLMRLYAQSGRRQHALRQFQTLEERLQSELGAAPDAKTQRLHRAILDGRYPARESGPESNITVESSRGAPRNGERPLDRPVEKAPPPRNNLPIQLSRFVGR